MSAGKSIEKIVDDFFVKEKKDGKLEMDTAGSWLESAFS